MVIFAHLGPLLTNLPVWADMARTTHSTISQKLVS